MPAAATEHVLDHVNRAHHLAYTLVGRLPGGYQQGAWLVRDSGDRSDEAVLKWSRAPGWSQQAHRAAPLVAQARAAGWPTPAWHAVGETPSGHAYQLQERAPGSPAGHVTLPVARAALRVIDGQAGIGPDTPHDWSRYDHRVVFEDEEGFSSALAALSPAGAEFVDAVRDRTAPFRDTRLPTADLVHGDFNPDNILLADGGTAVTVTAVTDAAALGKGTRLHDVATLIAYAALWPAESTEPAEPAEPARPAAPAEPAEPAHAAQPPVLPELYAYARRHAEVPGELEVALAATLLALLPFATARRPDDGDKLLRTATGLLTTLSPSPSPPQPHPPARA